MLFGKEPKFPRKINVTLPKKKIYVCIGSGRILKKVLQDEHQNSKIESIFVNDFDNLFDIVHEDTLTLLTIKEDETFLLAYAEKGRRGSTGKLTKLSKKEELIKK